MYLFLTTYEDRLFIFPTITITVTDVTVAFSLIWLHMIGGVMLGKFPYDETEN